MKKRTEQQSSLTIKTHNNKGDREGSCSVHSVPKDRAVADIISGDVNWLRSVNIPKKDEKNKSKHTIIKINPNHIKEISAKVATNIIENSKQNISKDKKFITMKDVCKLIGMSSFSVKRFMRRGRLPLPIKIGRNFKFDIGEVNEKTKKEHCPN
jgi:predicted DNA-binding transcriptional regulator AlpA